MGLELTEKQAQEMVAAIRDPENKYKLVLTRVSVNGIETRAICWKEVDEKGDQKLMPLALLVAPSLFTSIEMIFEE